MNSETSAAEVVDGHLVPVTDKPTELAQPQLDDPMLAMVEVMERLATNPDVTPEKLTQILDVQERILDRRAKMAYTAAMAQFREKCPQIIKDKIVDYPHRDGKGSTTFKHADLAGTLAQIQCLMNQCGLSHSWRYDQAILGFLTITCVITHSEGHSENTSITLPHDTSGKKNAIQAVGSTSSYGERYTLFAMLGLASAADDDGLAGAPATPVPLSKARKAQQARQQGPDPASQGDPEHAPAQVPEPDQPPAAPPNPPKPAPNTVSQAEAAKRIKFAEVCNVLAVACEVVQEGQTLAPTDFRAILAQAMALGGTDDLAEATSYVMSSARAIVRDESGIRLIPR